MDLDAHIHTRSFFKPDVRPLLKAVVGALIIHALFLFNWFANKEISPVEIPQWVNVKLIAGFETINEKRKPPEKKRKKIIKKTEDIKKKAPEAYPIKNNETSVEKKDKVTTKATTFIKADSRPYKLKNPKPLYPSAARRRGMQGVVFLSIKINKKGFVENINIEKTSGFRILDQSAVSSVSKWQFVPAKNDNEFVSSIVEFPVRFHLNDVQD